MPPRKPKPPADAATPASIPPGSSSFIEPEPFTLSPEKLRALEFRVLEDIRRYTSIFEPYRTQIRVWRDFLDGNVEPTWSPFRDASKVFIPLPRLVKAAAHSRIWQTIFQQKDVVVVESAMQESEAELAGFPLHDALKALQRCLNELCLDESEFNLKERCDAILDEATTVGSNPVRVYHNFRRTPRKRRYDPSGKLTVVNDFVEVNKVGIESLPAEVCMWDVTADSDCLRFFSHEFTLSYSEVNLYAKQHGWSPETLKQILSSPDTGPSPFQEDTHRRERLGSLGPAPADPRASTAGTYTFHELFYANTNLADDDIFEDITLWFHPATGRVTHVLLWPYIHNQLPITIINYEHVRHRPIGKGVIEPITPLSSAINAIANQTINSHTIRDNPIIVVPDQSDAQEKLEAGIVPGMVVAERVKGEIHTLEFGQAANTQVSIMLLDKLFDIAFLVNHLGPPQMGDVSSARRAPGGLGMSILQQGAELIDKIINRFRVSLGRIILQAFAIIWQTNRGKITRIVGQADAQLISQLMTSVGIDNLRVTLAVTSATYSRELDRQNYLAMIQTVLGYERQILELVRAMQGGIDPKSGQPIPQDPVFNAVATEVLRTTQNMMMHFIETFPQVTDASSYVPDTAAIIAEARASIDRIQEQLTQLGGGGPANPTGAVVGAGSVVSPPSPTLPGGAALGPGAGAILGAM